MSKVAKTQDQEISELIAYFKNKYDIPQGSIDNIMSYVGDNLYMFTPEQTGSAEYNSAELATIYANFETFLSGEWFDESYSYEGAEKFKK